MKRFTTLLIGVGISLAGIAQNVGIGTSTPNASALLELQSTNKGLLLPRVADTNAVASPAKGLVIYSTNANALFYYNGSSWQSTANIGSGSVWYQYQDSVLMTDKDYVNINPSPALKTPMSGLSVTGNLLIQPSVLASNTPPTAAQTLTMNNTASLQFLSSNDSVGRVFDPGGQNINYLNNMQGNCQIEGSADALGTVLSFNGADFGIAAGDTLWIGYSFFPTCRTNYVAMLTNTSVPPSTINLISRFAYIIFRSNSDGANSKGFDISLKRVYKDNQTKNTSSDGFGNALVFNSDDASFRAGNPLNKLGSGAGCVGCYESSGQGSFAASSGNSKGNSSTSFNSGNAIGDKSFAAAGNAISNGRNSIALGVDVIAQADYSTAIGQGTRAQSINSTAIGIYNDILTGTSETVWVNTDPLVYIGNGRGVFNRSNAMVIYKNANVDINGYTRLGKLSEGAPEIKMKELLVTSATTSNGQVTVDHGLNPSKIISVTTLLEWTTGYFAPTEYSADPLLRYNYFVSPTQIAIQNNAASCAYICSKPVKILITYKE